MQPSSREGQKNVVSSLTVHDILKPAQTGSKK